MLADFVADWTTRGYSGEGLVTKKFWIIQCDGTWGSVSVGVATVVTSTSGIKLRYAARLEFGNEDDRSTNNVAEYEAVLLD